MRDWAIVFLLLTASHASLLSVASIAARFRLAGESTRKLLHVVLGLMLCTLPWLFTSPTPVVALCAAYVALLAGARRWTWLNARVAGVIFGVSRRSAGDWLFPVAVALLFPVTRHDPPAWLAAMLTLTFADAAAALVGRRYGQFRYATPTGAAKSIEGSAAFAAVTFASAHLCLLLLAPTGRLESVLISLTLALVLTLIEALAPAGLDNLLVPLAAVLILHVARPLPPAHLVPLAASAALALIALLAMTLPDSTLADTPAAR